ncbi:hypothetical protein HHO37_07965 [Streptococcus ursoris]|uniref:Uncharacterized protein n=1 Tax=Streptococcus ratti TaxID=1341 RepID=A0A7X9LGV8_STRRT|nr:hypothetical protein [Streptococcus ratti]
MKAVSSLSSKKYDDETCFFIAQEASLLNPAKCSFCYKRRCCFGYSCSAGGIEGQRFSVLKAAWDHSMLADWLSGKKRFDHYKNEAETKASQP